MVQQENPLNGKRIAILVANGFEQEEMTRPRQALEEAGASVDIISPEKDQVKAWDHTDWGIEFQVDVHISEAEVERYDGLMLPGGVMNPDNMRRNKTVQQFIAGFFEAGKPVAAICHAPWLLIDAGYARGKTLTSYHTIQEDLRNAGANWVDQEVVVDNGLVTSRNPNDIPAFNRKMIEEFQEGIHEPA